MTERSAHEILNLFLEFLPLYHQKFSVLYHGVEDRRSPCSKNQNRAIMILQRRGRSTPSGLGRCLDMRKGSLTTLVDSLFKMGLVRREADPGDRRKILLSLTSAGKRYVVRQYESLAQKLMELFAGVPRPELEAFAGGLKTMVRLMKDL